MRAAMPLLLIDGVESANSIVAACPVMAMLGKCASINIDAADSAVNLAHIAPVMVIEMNVSALLVSAVFTVAKASALPDIEASTRTSVSIEPVLMFFTVALVSASPAIRVRTVVNVSALPVVCVLIDTRVSADPVSLVLITA